MIKHCLLFFIFFFMISFLEIQEGLEMIIKNEDDLLDLLEIEEISYKEYFLLSQLLTNKVNINSIEIFKLSILPGIKITSLKEIYNYYRKYGEFSKITDLKTLSFISEDTYKRLESFIYVKPERKIFTLKTKLYIKENLAENNDLKCIDTQILFLEKYKTYISYNQNEEKEEIETIYFVAKDLKFFKEIILGNYKAVFGEGLVIGNKFEGVFLTLGDKNLFTTFIYSDEEKIVGNNLDFLFSNLNAGITFYTQLDEKLVYGIHGNYLLKKDLKIFSEYAKINSKGKAYILGIDKFYKNLSILFLYRNYEEDFINSVSSGFANRDGKDDNNDEKGVYFEIKYHTPNLRLKGYFDEWFHFSTFTIDNEIFLQLFYKINPIKFSVFSKWHDEDISSSGRIQNTLTGEWIKTGIKIELDYIPKTKIYLYYTNSYKDVEKYMDKMQQDDYKKLAVQYLVSKFLKIKIGFYYQDTDIDIAGQVSKNYFFQIEDMINKIMKLKIYAQFKKYEELNFKSSFNFALYFKW